MAKLRHPLELEHLQFVDTSYNLVILDEIVYNKFKGVVAFQTCQTGHIAPGPVEYYHHQQSEHVSRF